MSEVMASTKVLAARKAASPTSIRLIPAAHHADARRIDDAELGFSFELPNGYEEMPRSSLPQKYSQGFMQRLPDGPPRLVLVSRMKKIAPQRLQSSDIPSGLENASLTTFEWRGLEIDGFRVLESKDDVHYVTFDAQVPLRKAGVQLGVGGSEQDEPLLRAMTGQILSTLEGETNW